MSVADMLAKRLARSHAWIMEALEPLDDASLREQLGPRAPSIAFHAWHVARWADRVHARLAGTDEVWQRDAVARRWGLDDDALGKHGTGMGLDDDASAALALPAKEQLLAYVREAFAAADRAAEAVRDDELETLVTDHYDRQAPKAQILIMHTGHASRHLGMIEALRGVQGERGTATL
jgi:uncharacterized damage-inducible protein DinB